jgi:hypothetical protein
VILGCLILGCLITDQIDELVAAVQQHASGSHGHDVPREHILAELVTL